MLVISRCCQYRLSTASRGRMTREWWIGKHFKWTGLFLTGVLSRNLAHVTEKQKILWRTNRLLSLIRHEPHWKRRIQQFFYCCACIHYRGNVSTEPLPSSDKGIFTEPLLATIRGIHRHTHTQQRDLIKCTIFWDITPCSPLIVHRRFETYIFDPHDGGDMFLRNVGWHSTDYTTLYPRRWHHCCENLKSYVIS
jgi:hypothetical protein